MLKRIAPALLAGMLAAPAHADEEQGWWYGGTLAATTDYVYRGVSQTDEGPAIQGSLDVGHSNGMYAGIWASNVDFDEPDGIDYELNLYVGWVYDFTEDTSLDVQVVRYLYPGANAGYSFNFNELIAALSFLEYYTVTAAYSNDWLNTDENAFYYHFGADIPLGIRDLNLKLGAGFNDISDAAGDDYWDFQAGINRDWGIFNVDLSYFDTSGYNSRVEDFLGPRGWADSRVVLTVSVEF
jgi:uncharacterized protein (TIGR02001 family)